MKRHRVNVMRPPASVDSRGQPQGNPTLVYEGWWCSINDLAAGGGKSVQARTVFAEARFQVDGYCEPSKPIFERDYLTGGMLGERELFIGSITDQDQNGSKISLLCSERTGG